MCNIHSIQQQEGSERCIENDFQGEVMDCFPIRIQDYKSMITDYRATKKERIKKCN
jgi:hypothetical protein